MSKSYAKFYKCALQVNPYSYIKYRGLEHEMTEEQYNESIYQYCKTNNISIIGLAIMVTLITRVNSDNI